MDSVLVPKEAANYLGAILLAFNRDISASLLEEAEQLASLGQPAAAVLIAGTVLEYLERSPATILVPIARRSELDEIRRLRNQVAHGSAAALNSEHVRRIIDAVRQAVSIEAGLVSSAQNSGTHNGGDASRIKGKYAYVRTSADELIRRKREELELEDRE